MNARFYVPYLNRFISADTIVPDPTNPQSYNRYSYVLNNPINFADPTGHRECHLDNLQCTPPVRVRSAPTGTDAAIERTDLATYFISVVGSFDWLQGELDFDEWIYSSGRLASEWWSVVNGYLLMSRFAALQIVQQGIDPTTTVDLEPGVAEWVEFIKDPTEENFWRAHNAALREGVRRADEAGLREQETVSEQEVIETVLQNVYSIGDRCANGSAFTCGITGSWSLSIGTLTYPHHYPALPSYAATMFRYNGTFLGIFGGGIDYVFWTFVSGISGCNRSFTACEGP